MKINRGDRVRGKYSGRIGTVSGIEAERGEVYHEIDFDKGTRDRVFAGDLELIERASEERMTTKTIEQRLDSAEKNLVDHEHAIGDNSGKISLVEQIDIAYEHLRRDATHIETLERNVGGHEHAIGRIGESQHEIKADHRALIDDHGKVVEAIKLGEMHDELHARRIEEVADKTAQRFDGHADKMARIDGELHELKEQVAELEERLARNVVGINGDAHAVYSGLDRRLAAVDKSLAALWRKFDAQRSAAKALRDGPKSYDKRLAALEAALAERRSANELRLIDFDGRLEALEQRDDDPLRRVPGVYSGTGDDATDDDGCEITLDEQRSIDRHVADEVQRAQLEREAVFVDPVPRDMNASERANSVTLRRATYAEIVAELARRV